MVTRPSKYQKRWTVGGGWTAGVVFAFVLLVGIGAATVEVYLRFLESVDRAQKANHVLEAVDRVLARLRDAESGQRGYLLTRQEGYLAPYRRAVAQMDEPIEALRQLVSSDEAQRNRVERLAGLVKEKTTELSETIRLSGEGARERALTRVLSGEGKSIMDDALALAEELRASETRVLQDRRLARAELRSMTGAMIGAVVLLALGLVAAAFVANAQLSGQRDALEGEVAAREAAELLLNESREQYRTTLSSIGDGVIATDIVGRVRFMNRIAESLTGWSFAEAEMRPIREIFRIVSEETRAEVANPVDRVTCEGQIVGLANHTLLIARDGTERPIDDSGAPIRAASGEISGVVLVFRDITERKRYEDERRSMLESERRARIDLERMSRVKDEFLATLSHELRTPLNAVIGWTHVLKHGGVSTEEQGQALDSIERNARLQARLIADLLDMSAMTAGQLQIDRRPLDFAAAVSATADSASPELRAKSVRLKKVLEPIVLPVMADPTRLQQVVWNLLSNAVKFTPAGGLVTVAVHRDGPNAELIVSDTGQGISASFLPRVFDRFQQEDSSLRRKHAGLGLGLAIVRQLVEAHGGSVRAESAGEGRGATFIVAWPLCEAAMALIGKSTPEQGQRAPELQGLRVLIVDDDEDGRELLARILRDSGCNVSMASSAEEGIKMIDVANPELIVSDISMPEIDGYEFLARVRRLEKGRKSQIAAIALSGFAQPEIGQHEAPLGYAAHVLKPIDPDDFLKLVAGVIAQHRRLVN